MAIIGGTLAVPEYGFARYEFINKDDLTLNNEYFYSVTASIIQDNNGLLAVGVSNGDEILVKIKNTYNFRLLVCLPSSTNANTLYTNNMVVEVDGVRHTYDLTSNQNTTIIDNCLVVDINNLSANSHIIKIYADGNNNDAQMINVQAIDIDTRGIVGFTRTMASMFEGCTNLKKDIIIPKNADMVENMFKNCTSMTHVRSNWDETYNDSGIITEGCYSGCTAITHIDDEALSLNEYANGLDNIPPEWGGYGYTKEYTGVYKVEILSPNYTFSFASDGLLDNGYINWGDGTVTQNEYSHTYVNAGVYTIKGKVHSPSRTVTDSMKLCLKEIIQYPIYGNLYYAFTDCATLVSANISGNKYFDSNESRTNAFNNCTNLERVIALDTKLEVSLRSTSVFQNCKKLREIIGINDFLYNANNISSCFHSCESLQNFTLSEDSLKNCTSFSMTFYHCTSLTESPIKTFASDKSSLNISRIFEGCTNITDISGITFGENINVADGWCPPNLTTANNIKINCVSLCGTHSTTNKLFRGCKTLKYVNNAVLGSNITSILHLFNGCSALESVSLSGGGELTDISYLFYNCIKLSSVNISGLNLSNVRYAGAVFQVCSSLKVLENITLGGLCYDSADYYDAGSFIKYSGVEVIRNCTFTTPAIKELFCTDQVPLRVVENITIDESITDLSGMFENCIHLKQDIVIPSHITNCSEMFKNCTSMTHIHSNWENEYRFDIVSTNCYSGCTAITHIDDDSVIAYKGDSALDYVPSEWGGNGLVDDGTVSIYEVTVPSDNFALQLFRWNYSFSRRFGTTSTDWTKISLDNHINWGDGVSSTSVSEDGGSNFPTHTYAKAGVYYIKGHFGNFGVGINPTASAYGFHDNAKSCITRILKSAYRGYHTQLYQYSEAMNLANHFNGLSSLKSVSGLKITSEVTKLEGLFQGCTSLISIDFDDCDTSNVATMTNMFQGCSSLASLDLSGFNTRNVTNMKAMFQNCSSLTSLDLSDFDVSSVTDVAHLLNGCTRLSNLNMRGLNFQSLVNSYFGTSERMFYNCSSLTENPYLQLASLDRFYEVDLRGCSSLPSTISFGNMPLTSTRVLYPASHLVEITGVIFPKPCNVQLQNVTSFRKISQINYDSSTQYGYWYYLSGAGSFETTFVGEIERIPANQASYTSCYLNGLRIMTEATKTSFVNALKDYSGQQTATLYGASKYLSSEQIAIANRKNWTVT